MQEVFDQDTLVAMVRRATQDVFGTMLGMELNPLTAYVETESPPPGAGILSLIGFTGPWIGTGSLSCSAETGCRIADALFACEHHAVDEEVLDAMAEMANMIFGNVKTELEDQSGPMLLNIPTVIYGRNFIKRSMGKRQWVIVPFTSAGHRIELQVCMIPNSDSAQSKPEMSHSYGVHA